MSAAIRIVLVDTSHPGNIGASARAMRNMGLESLVLVRPQAPPDGESLARAAGGADLVRNARVEPSVEAAVADCGLVLGASARARSANFRVLDARAAAAELVAASAARPAALLFGGERNGLSNEDLARCHALVRIPADPGYESLNLAQAVQVLCYEIRLAAGAASAQPGAEPPASAKELAALWAHLDAVAGRVGFMHDGNAAQLAARIRRLLARAVPDAGEVRILRGLLAAIERRLPPAAAGP
ncbi:MAG TPA: RNA methyltransferase [Steroidobacteraceae bacterium]|nr:RNA methyltransferase [Steroidobacteraceae bacterium]